MHYLISVRFRMHFIGGALSLLLLACASSQRTGPALTELENDSLQSRINGDAIAVVTYRDGLKRVMDYVNTRTDVFPGSGKEDALLTERQRTEARKIYSSFLDYLLALQSIDRYHRSFYRLPDDADEDSMLVMYSAFLARYRFAMDFIKRIEKDPAYVKILNEPIGELGIPEGSYSNLKFKYLNVGRGMGYVALQTVYATNQGNRRPRLRELIDIDKKVIAKYGLWNGPLMTLENAFSIIGSSGQSAWMPVQSGVAEWMGDTKVKRIGNPLISHEQIQMAHEKMEPGDFMVQRREWYLSNIGLPGFWSHAALYVGSPKERRAYFNDGQVKNWVRSNGVASGDFEDLLNRKYPDAISKSQEPEAGHPRVVLEAMSEGVVFTSMEHSAAADSLGVLRPRRLSKLAKARALFRAFRYAGRPYDFNFDFQTDASLVCTELIYKAYEPIAGQGIRIPMTKMLGRFALPANEYVRLFDQEYGRADAQLELILFLDGIEDSDKAIVSDVATFQQSWKRPKWHIFVQEDVSGMRSIADDYVTDSTPLQNFLPVSILPEQGSKKYIW